MTIALIAGWLTLHGCSIACASGITANIEQESGGQPCTVTRSGIGVAQWSGARRRRLLATYRERWCDLNNQLSFLVTELTEMGLRERLFASTSPEAAAVLFRDQFECPRYRSASRERRAREIYGQLVAAGAVP